MDQEEVQKLRQEAGSWLRKLREEAGYSQRELAKRVGLEYYTFISQIESGRGRVPPGQTKAFAEALNVSVRDFAIQMLRFYDPLHHELIFGTEARIEERARANETLEQRLERLEKLMNKLA
ncbi:helix-turn-helix transcriptional regulator [Mesorhizobium sp. CAU 1741]|uniref:helix-turn-helix domain-containing protein n=1 Tax=Mesorhizobium sp. CAU 1741 TaxID=3140366 RepID=UPI00325AF82F